MTTTPSSIMARRAAAGGAPQIEVADTPPYELLKHDAPLHDTVLERLNARIKLSLDHMKERFDAWDQVDEHVRCYIDLSRKRKRADGTVDRSKLEMPFDNAIVVPVSYTILWTRLTGLMALFGNRVPMYQIEGTGGEDVEPARMLEMMLAYDTRQMGEILPLFAMLQDAEKYGLGVLTDSWEEEKGYVYRDNPVAGSGLMAKLYQMVSGKKPDRKLKEWGTAKEYNKWTPVDPFAFLPDPRKPLSELQSSEFCGHTSYRSYLHLVENEMPDGPYFNVDEARKLQHSKSDERVYEHRSRSRNNLSSFQLSGDKLDEADKGFYYLDNMQVKLIPRDWNLSDQEKPEIWQFAVCQGKVIVRAHPTPYEHQRFTYGVAEPNYDPHTLFNPGNIELIDGMQRMMNWFLTSHLENVRRTINNASVFSPLFIREDDIRNPNPGGHVRLTEMGERLVQRGLPISSFFHQVNVQDMTSGHLKTMEHMFELVKVMSSINDPAMGQPTPSKRTLGEVQRIVFSQEQRIATTARVVDSLALRPLIERAISNRQQWTDLERMYRIVGEAAYKLDDPFQLIGRADILGNFDYVPNTGTVPPDPTRFAEVWIQVMQAAGQIPQLFEPDAEGKMLNIRTVFDEFLRNLGIKNLNSFYMQAPIQVLSDDEIADEVDAGNIVPMPDGTDAMSSARGAANAA